MSLSTLRSASMLVVLTICSAHLIAQSPDPPASKDTLYQTISQLDADLFSAMNRCDMDKFASYWAEDLEFYRDKDGLSRLKTQCQSPLLPTLYIPIR